MNARRGGSIAWEHLLLKIKALRARALDPHGLRLGGFRRFGLSPDPPRWLAFHMLFLRTRAVAWASGFLSNICCTDRIFKSPFRAGIGAWLQATAADVAPVSVRAGNLATARVPTPAR